VLDDGAGGDDQNESEGKAAARRGRLRFGRDAAAGSGDPRSLGTTVSPKLFEETAPVIADLEARNAELAHQLDELRRQPPDLSRLSEADLAVLASDTAARILRAARHDSEASALAAREHLDATHREAADHLEQAKAEAEQIVQSASDRARAQRETAEVEDRRIRQEADAYATEVRQKANADASALLARARDEAAEVMANHKLEVEKFLESAKARRDAIFADLDLQRRLMQTTLEDAAAIQAAFTEGYGQLRKGLDDAIAHLIEPVSRARRQIANLDREIFNQERDEDLVDFGPARRYGIARTDPQPASRARRRRTRS
jgi:hypothetical protein